MRDLAAGVDQNRCDWQREKREDRNEKAGWSTRSAPPHVIPAGVNRVWQRGADHHDRRGPPPPISPQDSYAKRGQHVYRAVDQQTEFLVDEQAQEAARDVLESECQLGGPR